MSFCFKSPAFLVSSNQLYCFIIMQSYDLQQTQNRIDGKKRSFERSFLFQPSLPVNFYFRKGLLSTVSNTQKLYTNLWAAAALNCDFQFFKDVKYILLIRVLSFSTNFLWDFPCINYNCLMKKMDLAFKMFIGHVTSFQSLAGIWDFRISSSLGRM